MDNLQHTLVIPSPASSSKLVLINVVCPNCTGNFSTYKDLQDHLQTCQKTIVSEAPTPVKLSESIVQGLLDDILTNLPYERFSSYGSLSQNFKKKYVKSLFQVPNLNGKQIRRYNCRECNQSFLGSAKHHINTFHGGYWMVAICHFCDRHFPTQDELKEHQEVSNHIEFEGEFVK